MPKNTPHSSDCVRWKIATNETAIFAFPGFFSDLAHGIPFVEFPSSVRDDDIVMLLRSPRGTCDLVSTLNIEAWSSLPGRLAALAIQPPLDAVLLARSTEATRQVFDLLGDEATQDEFSLWRWLIDITKRRLKIWGLGESPNFGWMSPASLTEPPSEPATPELVLSPPSKRLTWLFDELNSLRPSDICHDAEPTAATAFLAGLWLLHGNGDRSHRLSQTIEDEGRNRHGNYWHGIMHRQEPDYGNAKYWFRRVGPHPVFPELARRADSLFAADPSDGVQRWRKKLGLPQRWDPLAFVDLCEEAAAGRSQSLASVARRIQFLEMHLLLRATFADASQSDEP